MPPWAFVFTGGEGESLELEILGAPGVSGLRADTLLSASAGHAGWPSLRLDTLSEESSDMVVVCALLVS